MLLFFVLAEVYATSVLTIFFVLVAAYAFRITPDQLLVLIEQKVLFLSLPIFSLFLWTYWIHKRKDRFTSQWSEQAIYNLYDWPILAVKIPWRLKASSSNHPYVIGKIAWNWLHAVGNGIIVLATILYLLG